MSRPPFDDPARAGRHDREKVGDPTYIALDVLLDDGHSEVFWHHELEEIAERA